jgi:hypothetical protein
MLNRLTFLCLFFSLLHYSPAIGQQRSKVELSIQLVVPDVLGERILDSEPFFEWVKLLNASFESEMKMLSGNHEGLLLINLTKDNPAEYNLSFKPPLDDASRLKILKELKILPNYHTRFGEYTFLVRGVLNKGSTRKGDNYYPPVIFPREQRVYDFGQMTLEDKTVFLKKWVDETIIPALILFELDVDSQFLGVKSVGEMLNDGLYAGQNTSSFIDTNYNYWRAILEMSKGNQLIPLSRICMYLSNEEWDLAQNYLRITSLFSDKNSLADYYSEEIRDFLKMLIEHANLEIEEGIKLFDQGDLKGAELKYGSLHRIVPKIAFLNYEMYLTEVAVLKKTDSLGLDETRMVWDKYSKSIYKVNPVYTSMAQASSANEGYELVCRAMIKDLFKENGETKRDLLLYADLALELEDYALSAHIYWWLFTYIGNDAYENRELLTDFLYALHQMGDTKVRDNFKGDFDLEFKKIDSRRKSIKEADTMYQSFVK